MSSAEPKFTSGPWHVCNSGKCSCFTVMCNDFPVAEVTHGEWGDDFPAIRLVGDSTIDRKAEAYMEQITYGSVDDAEARANWHLISASPDLYAALVETLEIASRNEDGEWAVRARAALSKANPEPTVDA